MLQIPQDRKFVLFFVSNRIRLKETTDPTDITRRYILDQTHTFKRSKILYSNAPH